MRNIRLSLPQAHGQVGQRESHSELAVPTPRGGGRVSFRSVLWATAPAAKLPSPSLCPLYLSKTEIPMLPQQKDVCVWGEVLGRACWCFCPQARPAGEGISAQTCSQAALRAVTTVGSQAGSWE